MPPRLTRAFLARPAQVVAAQLIGCTIVRVLPTGERVAGMIVETEAYMGVRDMASHTYNARRTPRNEPMWGRAGHSYVYFTYGMHHCCNVVCGAEGEPVAVLLRALEPVEGLEAMARLRGVPALARDGSPNRALCAGPARLCQALALTRGENLIDMVTSDVLWLEARPRGMKRPKLRRGPRVGIDSAGVWAPKPLRWVLATSAYISVPIAPVVRRTISRG